jgi:hypothetical protein
MEQGAGIEWVKPFPFLLDPKVMEEVGILSENDRRRGIPPPVN